MNGPKMLDDAEVAARLAWPELLDAIEQVLTEDGAGGPTRTLHQVERPGASPLSLLMKPAWSVGDTVVVKVVTVVDDNGPRGLAGVNAGVLMFDGTDGRLLGLAAGNELTTRRTAAASAVAARRLARTDARRLLVVGTGALAPRLAEAHAQVRDHDTIEVWGRDVARAAAVAASLRDSGLHAVAVEDLRSAVRAADVITCGTSSTEPLVLGADVRPGTHVDLVGAFSPTTRESDDDLIASARIWLDHLEDATIAGDMASPLAAGRVSIDDVVGDLTQLVRGEVEGRSTDDEITVFKSAGMAVEDLAAMRLAVGD